jgi:hypothetical protein
MNLDTFKLATRALLQFKKEVERSLWVELRKQRKASNASIISNCIYKRIEGFIVDQSVALQATDDKNIVVRLRFSGKPYIYDDIFWEIMDMEENRKAPESLRVNGAFTCPAYIVRTDEINYVNPSTTALTIIETFSRNAEEFLSGLDYRVDSFIDMVDQKEEPFYGSDILKFLGLVCSGQIERARSIALERIEKGDGGRFESGGKSFYQHFVCERGLNTTTNTICGTVADQRDGVRKIGKYDDASWHYGGNFPADLPQENGATHIGMFLTWCIENDYLSEEHLEESGEYVQAVKAHEMTGAEFLMEILDGKLCDSDLSSIGKSFADDYYVSGDKSKFVKQFSDYFGDYAQTLDTEDNDDLYSLYRLEDSWSNYELIKDVINQRFLEWKNHFLGEG